MSKKNTTAVKNILDSYLQPFIAAAAEEAAKVAAEKAAAMPVEDIVPLPEFPDWKCQSTTCKRRRTKNCRHG